MKTLVNTPEMQYKFDLPSIPEVNTKIVLNTQFWGRIERRVSRVTLELSTTDQAKTVIIDTIEYVP